MSSSYYINYINESYDDRLSNYFLMGSIYKIFAVLGSYWIFVKIIGPKIMEKRKPYDLSRIMPIYNLLQVFLNICCAFRILYVVSNESREFFDCPLVDKSRTERGYALAHLEYFYYLLKVLDLMDTIFIILKKNYRQASVLHLYHHTIMALGGYVHMQYYPAGLYCLPGAMNCIIHVIMYFYFFLTTVRSDIKQSLWWKKYITQCQIIQFCINLILYLRVAINYDCEYSKFWSWFGFSQNVIFLLMFSNFYIRNYLFSKTQTKTKSDKLN